MKAEEKGCGAVAWSVYAAYIRAAGGPVAFAANVFFFLATTGSIAFSNWWLSHWIKQGSGVSESGCLHMQYTPVVQKVLSCFASRRIWSIFLVLFFSSPSTLAPIYL